MHGLQSMIINENNTEIYLRAPKDLNQLGTVNNGFLTKTSDKMKLTKTVDLTK